MTTSKTAKNVPANNVPANNVPAKTAPVKTAPVKTAPVKTAPVKKAIAPKPKGTRRVATQTAKSLVSRFVMNTPFAINAMNDAQAVAKKVVHDKSGAKTCFGHNANDAMTSVLDRLLIDFMNGKAIDSKIVIDTAFNALTTTDKLDGKNNGEKVIFTFNKVIDHYNTFNVEKSGFKKHLAKKQYNVLTYSPLELQAIGNGLLGFIKPVISDLMQARKAAKITYKADLIAKK